MRHPLINEAIGPFYVYLLVDPANGEILYVGKGAGWRFAAHVRDEEQIVGDYAVSDEELGAKQARIAAIRARGDEPLVEFARRQIDHAEEAYLVEAALIDVLRRHGSPSLANQVRGRGAELGLITLAELQEQSATPPLETPLKAIWIKLGGGQMRRTASSLVSATAPSAA